MIIFLFLFPFLIFISSVASVNVLVYSPAFAASHTNFMARLADTLTEAGHNVTFLVPIVDVARRSQLGVRITTDVVIVEQDAQTSQESVPFDDNMGMYWEEHVDSTNIKETFKWFIDGMVLACDNFLRHDNIFHQMKSRNFDVAIVEPLSVCGLGFAKALGIEKTILASSCAHYDMIFPFIGEPTEQSWLPSIVSLTGEKMNFAERYENYRVADEWRNGFVEMFDEEQKSFEKHFPGNIPNWRELLPAASLFFTNSNPYLDFPRPALQKTIPIGGISVNMEHIKAQKLDEHWNELLDKRQLNMLISFGSMIHSSHMPEESRQNLLNVIRSEPNVTFIWKYETNETAFARGVDNVYFSKWVPQAALLHDPRLTAFLTHGGLGSTNELAHCAKPAVMVPIFGDQHRNAHMLERHGSVVVVLKRDLVKWEVVKQAVHSVLYDGKFERNARHLAEMLQNQPIKPTEQVLKYTEFVARYGPFPQMDPFGRQLYSFQRALLDVYLFEFLVHFLCFAALFYIFPFQFFKLFFRIRKVKQD